MALPKSFPFMGQTVKPNNNEDGIITVGCAWDLAAPNAQGQAYVQASMAACNGSNGM